MANFNWPLTASQAAPLEFILDGIATQVEEDTVILANSIPLPVKVLDGTGTEVDFATEAKQDVQITALNDINTELNTQTAILTTIDASLNVIEVIDFATQAKQDVQITALNDINTELNTQTAILTTIDADTGAITVSTASIDTKLTTTNSTLATIDTSLNNIEAVDFATQAKQDVQITGLNDINTELNSQTAILTTIDADTGSIDAKIPANLTVTATRLLVDGSGVTQPVSVTSLPLPTGAATEAKQDTQITGLNDINTELNTQTALLTTIDADTGSIDSKIPANLTVTSTRLLVDGSGVTQPVSAASLPLPTGAATEATLATLSGNSSRLSVVDQIDTTPLLSVASSNIPASASSPLQIVASLAANVYKVISVEDIGEFIGLYTGAAASEVLNCVLPLGGGEVEVNIPAGTRISLRNMKNAAITTDFIALNFLG